MTDIEFSLPPSLADLDAMARRALNDIPRLLARHLDNVMIRVDDFPDAAVEQEMKLESPFDILGLYQGVALTQKSGGAAGETVDMIFLYRRPILDYWCETEDDLYAIVRNVLIHEIGHHFGFSDDDMERLEHED
jgi:predicted Zn-dependent protease with MMP-like domain